MTLLLNCSLPRDSMSQLTPSALSNSSGAIQMPPNLLLYPVLDHREASMRIADTEVVHPTTKDRVDPLNSITFPPGWPTFCRKISLSFANNSVRFFSFGA